MLDILTTLTQPWAEYFSASAWVPTAVIALHLLAMFVSGGIALAADRRLLQATPDSGEAIEAAATELRTTHGIVIGSLAVTMLSGAALFAADVGTFWGSRVFWAKMITLVALLLNGVRMRSTESLLLANARHVSAVVIADPTRTGPWRTLRTHAWISACLWSAIVVLGAIVANI